MSVKASQAQSTMSIKEMTKMFLPIILFSIILPLIDIVTDLRLIIRLYSSRLLSCILSEDLIWNEMDVIDRRDVRVRGYYTYKDGNRNVSFDEWLDCVRSDDFSDFCQQNPNPCIWEKHINLATLLLGEYLCS